MLSRLAGHRDWIRGISACGPTLLSGDAKSILGIWDLPSQQNRDMFIHPYHDEAELNVLMDLVFLPESDSCFYMLQRSGRLSLADLRVRDYIQWTSQLGMVKPARMKILENHHQLLISARGSEIKLWENRTTPVTCLQRYCEHKSDGLPLGFDTLLYEKYLVTGSDDGYAYIYEISTGCLMRKIKLGSGQLQSCCAESPDSLSFFVSFEDSRYLGLVDTEGIDHIHEFASTTQIKEMYKKKAWDVALSKFTQRLAVHMQHLMGGTPYGQNNWIVVLRASEEKESKILLADIEAEYSLQLAACSPALVRDLTAFYQRKEEPKCLIFHLEQSVRSVKYCSLAPRVQKEYERVADRPSYLVEL